MRPSQQEPFEIEIRKIFYDPKTDSEFEEIETYNSGKDRMPSDGIFPSQGYIGFDDSVIKTRKITWIDKFLRGLFD